MSLKRLKELGEKNGFEVPDKIEEFDGLESSWDPISEEYFEVNVTYGDDFSEILLNLSIVTEKYEEDKFVALKLDNMGATFNSFPSEIKRLKHLKALNISWWLGKIPSIPLEIFSLSNLEYLVLTHNKFQDLPSEIGQLKNLKELTLKNNEITFLPKEIGKLESLKILNLKKNKLTTVPDELAELENLEQLWLNGNKILEEEEKRIEEVLGNVIITFFP